MRTFLSASAVLLSGILSVGAVPCSAECLCGPVQARNVGKLLFQSNPLVEIDKNQWDAYVQWIRSNAHLLTRDGPTMACARNLGSAFTNFGLRSFNQNDYDESYGSVLEMGGDIDMARDVADSMRSGSLDAFTTGQELLWLARVVPSAAAGSWDPFLTTGTQARLQFRQVIPILQQVRMDLDLQQLKPLIDQFGPMVEEQMVMAGCLFRR